MKEEKIKNLMWLIGIIGSLLLGSIAMLLGYTNDTALIVALLYYFMFTLRLTLIK